MTAWEKAEIAKNAMIEKKGRQVLALDVTNITEIADIFLICRAQNRTQAQAIANEVRHQLQLQDVRAFRMEGFETGSWVLLDYGDVIVHIFQPEEYEYFNLPRLWKDAEFIEFDEDGRRK